MWGKDDGDYDSPTSRDEIPDLKLKEAKRNPNKIKSKEKMREKSEGAMLLSFYHTYASK